MKTTEKQRSDSKAYYLANREQYGYVHFDSFSKWCEPQVMGIKVVPRYSKDNF
jgi:hypothetical protein